MAPLQTSVKEKDLAFQEFTKQKIKKDKLVEKSKPVPEELSNLYVMSRNYYGILNYQSIQQGEKAMK